MPHHRECIEEFKIYLKHCLWNLWLQWGWVIISFPPYCRSPSPLLPAKPFSHVSQNNHQSDKRNHKESSSRVSKSFTQSHFLQLLWAPCGVACNFFEGHDVTAAAFEIQWWKVMCHNIICLCHSSWYLVDSYDPSLLMPSAACFQWAPDRCAELPVPHTVWMWLSGEADSRSESQQQDSEC